MAERNASSRGSSGCGRSVIVYRVLFGESDILLLRVCDIFLIADRSTNGEAVGVFGSAGGDLGRRDRPG